MDIKKQFEIYASKATVIYQDPQSKARAAFKVIQNVLTEEEKKELSIAYSHYKDCGEGREEFDEICCKIRKRLFGKHK